MILGYKTVLSGKQLFRCIMKKVDRVQTSPNSTMNYKEAITFWSFTKGIKAVHPNVLLMTNLIQGEE